MFCITPQDNITMSSCTFPSKIIYTELVEKAKNILMISLEDIDKTSHLFSLLVLHFFTCRFQSVW